MGRALTSLRGMGGSANRPYQMEAEGRGMGPRIDARTREGVDSCLRLHGGTQCGDAEDGWPKGNNEGGPWQRDSSAPLA